MDSILNPIIAAILIAFASFSGLLFVTKNSRLWLLRNLKYLVTFSAGVFLMTSLGLVGEAFDLINKEIIAVSVLGGFILLWVIQAILPEVHHHHDDECPDCVSSKSGIKTLIGDAIHNLGDGILLVPAFAISFEVGLIVAVSIFVHEFIQEISEFFVLRNSGFSFRRALGFNFMTSLSILVGVGLGFVLINSTHIQGILLAVTAGAFLQIVVHDLFPFSTVRKVRSALAWKHLGLFVLGIALIFSINMIMPHENDLNQDSFELVREN